MLKEERQVRILEHVNREGFMKIDSLIKIINCSSITLRRDINDLDQQGKLIKVHGGAMSLTMNKSKKDESLQDRGKMNQDAKKEIAMKAAAFVKDGMKIYLDAGTTIGMMITYLGHKKDLIVYTHGVHHVDTLLELGIECHIVGGEVKPTTFAVVGSKAVSYIQNLRFDCCFIGANAVDEEFGYSTPDEAEATMKQQIMAQSDHVYVLADESKLHKKSYVSFAKKDDAELITEYVEKGK